MVRILAMLSVLFLAGACQVLGGSEPAAESGGSSAQSSTNDDGEAIQWERGPYSVVFRADVVGGEVQDAFYYPNHVPDCTIYGDGHMIWTNDGPDGNQVLIDQISDAAIRDFVSYLTVTERIYTYDAPSEYEISDVAPVVETLSLNVNDTSHTTDAFADWPADYYTEVLDACKALGQTAAIYEPQAAWVSAQGTFYDASSPTYLWDNDASGLDLRELNEADGPRWIEGQAVRVIWQEIQRNSMDLLFADDVSAYYVVLQVPGVTIDAPPAP